MVKHPSLTPLLLCSHLKTFEKTQWRKELRSKLTHTGAAAVVAVYFWKHVKRHSGEKSLTRVLLLLLLLLCYCVTVLLCYCVHTVQKSHSHGCCCYCVHLQIKPSLQFPFTEWLNFCLFWKSSFFFCDPLALLKLPFSFKLFFRAEGWIFISCCYKNSKCAPMSLLLLGQADFFFFIWRLAFQREDCMQKCEFLSNLCRILSKDDFCKQPAVPAYHFKHIQLGIGCLLISNMYTKRGTYF